MKPLPPTREVEVIYIASQRLRHAASSVWSMLAAVLCEKPLTITREHARAVWSGTEKHLFLMEAFWIWLPLYDRLRKILGR